MHIGNNIRTIIKQRRISVSWFASQICCTRTHVYKIFNNENIDVKLLERISKVLDYDFFKDISTSIQEKNHERVLFFTIQVVSCYDTAIYHLIFYIHITLQSNKI